MSIDRLTQIRRSHASAKPVLANPAWRNTHSDLDYALGVIDEMTETLERVDKVLREFEGMTGAGYRYMAANIRAVITVKPGESE